MKLKNAAMSEVVRQDANMRFAYIEGFDGRADGVAGSSSNQPSSIVDVVRLTGIKGWQ